MPSVTRRLRTRDPEIKAGVEDALLGAMERLLANGQSFTSVSVEQLASEAGIARSTFYLHFRDKGDLVQRLMLKVTQELVSAAGIWFEKPEMASPVEMRAALERIVNVYDQHRAVMSAVVETSTYDPNVAQVFHGMMHSLVGESRRTLERIRRSGRASPGLTPEIADILTWAVERACYQLMTGKERIENNRLVDSLLHICWNAIYGAGVPAPR